MKKTVIILSVFLFNVVLKAQLIVYPGAGPQNHEFEATVNGKSLYINEVEVNLGRMPVQENRVKSAMTYFDFKGDVTIKVTSKVSFKSVSIRPLSAGITPRILGNTVEFKLSKPQKLVMEFDNDLARTIQIFANAPETYKPDPANPNVVYFSPGFHNAGTINLKSNQTIYLEGGAYVNGVIRGENVSNAKVCGRGILSGQGIKGNVFRLNGGSNIEISGITFAYPSTWTVVPRGVDHLTIDNVNIFGAGLGSDGIDVCSCQDVVINNCYIRNWDDNIVIKSHAGENSRNITVSNSIMNSECAQALEIGVELETDSVYNIVFKDIDIIHQKMWGYGALSINNGGHATVSNILYENIRVEDIDPASLFINLWIGESQWSKDSRGAIKGITFRNVSFSGNHVPISVISGFNASHQVQDVVFEHLTINGNMIKNAEQGNIYINEYAKNISFKPQGAAKKMATESYSDSVIEFNNDPQIHWQHPAIQPKNIKVSGISVDGHDFIFTPANRPTLYGPVFCDIPVEILKKGNELSFQIDIPEGHSVKIKGFELNEKLWWEKVKPEVTFGIQGVMDSEIVSGTFKTDHTASENFLSAHFKKPVELKPGHYKAVFGIKTENVEKATIYISKLKLSIEL